MLPRAHESPQERPRVSGRPRARVRRLHVLQGKFEQIQTPLERTRVAESTRTIVAESARESPRAHESFRERTRIDESLRESTKAHKSCREHTRDVESPRESMRAHETRRELKRVESFKPIVECFLCPWFYTATIEGIKGPFVLVT